MSSLDVVRSVYEAFALGDVPTVVGAMSPDIEWREAEGNPYMPSGQPWVGPDAVVNNLFVRIAGDWDGFTIHRRTFHSAGDVIVMEGRYTGTHKGTGRSMDAQVCHVWRVRDGRLASFQQYVDTAQLQRVMEGRQGA